MDAFPTFPVHGLCDEEILLYRGLKASREPRGRAKMGSDLTEHLDKKAFASLGCDFGCWYMLVAKFSGHQFGP